MQSEFWRERWEKNEIAFHQRDGNAALPQYWPRLHLPAAAPVFVPLCGKSHDMLWLRALGHSVLGIEFIEMAVRDFFAENGLKPRIEAQPPFTRWEADGVTILHGDFFDLTPEHLKQVGGVYDRASIIALPIGLRARYVGKLKEILPKTASILLVTLNYPEGQMQGPPFAVPETEVRSLFSDEYQVDLLATRDILSENSRFRERGLTRLTEEVYRLRRSAR